MLHRPVVAAELDVIMIQELWQNPFHPTFFNSPDSGFHLVYTPAPHTRVCFYINSQLDSDCWKIDNTGNPDITTLSLHTMCRDILATIQVHTIYNLSPHHQTVMEVPVINKLAVHLQATPDILLYFILFDCYTDSSVSAMQIF